MSTRRPGSRTPAVDFEQFLIEHLPLVGRVVQFVALRNHLSAADADDLASHVRLRLVEDDYAILRKFQGRSRLDTYLNTIVQRIYLDLRNSEWGKWRPSAAARRRGGAAVELERLVVRDGLSLDEAVGTLTSRNGEYTASALQAIWRELPARAVRRFAGEEELVYVAADGALIDEVIEAADDQRLADRVGQALRQVMQGLSEQEQLVLKLRFVDGASVAHVSRVLGLDQKALYRRLDVLHREMRDALTAAGFDRTSIERIVGHPLVAIGDVLGVEPPEDS